MSTADNPHSRLIQGRSSNEKSQYLRVTPFDRRFSIAESDRLLVEGTDEDGGIVVLNLSRQQLLSALLV